MAPSQRGHIEAKRGSAKTHEYIPPAFINAVQSVANDFKEFGDLVLSTRGLNALPAYEDPAAPKPGSVHAKSSTQKFVETRLPVDPRLSRIEAGGNVRGYAADDFPRDAKGNVTIPTVQEQKNLSRIVKGIADGTYAQVDTDEEIKKSGVLRVRVNSKNATEAAPIFSVHLDQGVKPISIERAQTLADYEEKAPPVPKWWDPKNGDWSARFNYRHPAYVQFPEEDKAQALRIYGQKTASGVLPITSDIDGASLTVPIKLKERMEAKGYGSAFIEIDTKQKGSESKNVAIMVNELVKINEFMGSIGKPKVSLAQIRENATMMGNGTPFEVYVSIRINANFGLGIQHIRNPLQHGFENRNNTTLQNLESGSIVHIGCQQGKKFVYETEGVKQYTDFMLKTKIAERGDLHINPGWKMADWHEVVARKLELGQKVSEKTQVDFQSYRSEQQSHNVASLRRPCR